MRDEGEGVVALHTIYSICNMLDGTVWHASTYGHIHDRTWVSWRVPLLGRSVSVAGEGGPASRDATRVRGWDWLVVRACERSFAYYAETMSRLNVLVLESG